jgi:hypothetical protein
MAEGSEHYVVAAARAVGAVTKARLMCRMWA